MPIYEGSPKHKSWLRPFDPDATQCPAWSHEGRSTCSTTASLILRVKRRFATHRGMAFAARPPRADIWHGYTVPWAEVPESVRKRFVRDGKFLSSEALAAELEP